jgi:hypothetical protein
LSKFAKIICAIVCVCLLLKLLRIRFQLLVVVALKIVPHSEQIFNVKKSLSHNNFCPLYAKPVSRVLYSNITCNPRARNIKIVAIHDIA